MDEAVEAIVNFLGMQPCDGTGKLKPDNANGAKPHMLHMSGAFVSGSQVLARAQVAMQPTGGVVLKIAVRSDDEAVSRMVADCIH
jgi:coatomer protein complex subunit gamma